MGTALRHKLLRDVVRLRGQVITIALVIAAGITSFVTLRGTYASLEVERARFYEQQRFADVFVQVERAPESVSAAIEALPGVALVESRVVQPCMLPLPQLAEPVRGSVVSLAEDPQLNLVQLSEGRMPEPHRVDEVVLLEAFANAQKVRPGDPLPVVLNGKKRQVHVVGIAMSPEYVMAIAAGALAPDPNRFVVLWMPRPALAAAFQQEGAFNDLSIELRPGASVAGTVDAVDRILAPYGSVGAYGRDRQASNRALDGELAQLAGMSSVLPAIFLAVAALLVNLVLSRLVLLQRPEIATLKALGYANRQVGLHFLELVLIVGGAGCVVGVALGRWLGGTMVGLYRQFFKFPNLEFILNVGDVLAAVVITLAAATVGAFGSVRSATRLPPAEAMRPPSPARYRPSVAERLHIPLGPSAQMVLRELERRPLRALLSALAIAAATALTVVGGWYYDGVEALFNTQFHLIMREDAAVTFIRPRPERAVRELAHLPGVLSAEGLRVVPVRFHAMHHQRDAVLWGYPDNVEMRRLRNTFGKEVPLPPDGVILTDVLAKILGVAVGDSVAVELHEGARGTRHLVVAGLVNELFGLAGHMRADALHAWLGETPHVSLALLRIDPRQARVLDERIKDLPSVVDVTKRSGIVQRFKEQSGNMITTMALIIALFAATITIGVVYNNARVALSMRGRDLASLRVLGFTRREISSILLGEQFIQVLAALPLGLVMGNGLVHLLAMTVDPETYRLPVILTSRSYGFAVVVTLLSAVVSALLVRRRLDHLDLVAVLKTRE